MIDLEKLYKFIKGELICVDGSCEECLQRLELDTCPYADNPEYKETLENFCSLLETKIDERSASEISDAEFINLLFSGGEQIV